MPELCPTDRRPKPAPPPAGRGSHPARHFFDGRTKPGRRLRALVGPSPAQRLRALGEALVLAEMARDAAYRALVAGNAAQASERALTRRRRTALVAAQRVARLHDALVAVAVQEREPRDPLAALRAVMGESK